MKEGLSLQELEEMINKLIVSNVQYEERILNFLEINYHLKGSYNSFGWFIYDVNYKGKPTIDWI
jgi:hypothetical protein